VVAACQVTGNAAMAWIRLAGDATLTRGDKMMNKRRTETLTLPPFEDRDHVTSWTSLLFSLLSFFFSLFSSHFSLLTFLFSLFSSLSSLLSLLYLFSRIWCTRY
jgi:hypothetical protein